jgi:hypothetical protein
MRKSKSGRTADLPAERPPATLIWTLERCIVLARYLYAFIEMSFGTEVAKQAWREASRRPRKRAIKVLSDDDMAIVLQCQVEAAKDPRAKPGTVARQVAKIREPDAGPDRLRNLTKTILRMVDRHKKSANGHREAVAVRAPDDVVINIDRVPKWPF